jgi:tetratricopeptide (TPR) repeat protein
MPTTLASEEAPEEEVEEMEEEPVAVLEPEQPPDEFDAEAVEVETSVDGWGEPEAEVVAPEEPPLEAVEEEEAAPADRIAELEVRLEAEGRTAELLVDLAEAVLEIGETEAATAHLEEALASYEAQNRFNRAGRVLDELIRLNVNDMRAYQKRVEYALRGGDRGALIEAYLGLADCLDRTDAGNKARVVYARVLELDPENHRAVSALEMFVEEPTATPGQDGAAATSSEEYVDLGSLVAEPEPEAKSTRFIVPTANPQSETDVDFSEMLDQFKSKVAEAIDKEDASSHYDLGLAFKDMSLLDEAIAEFQIAARSHEYRLRAIEMLGDCFLEKGDYRIALKVLSRALQVSGYTDDELIGIFYLTGRAFESLDEDGAALEWYERVMGCDVHFRDASQRVSGLRA